MFVILVSFLTRPVSVKSEQCFDGYPLTTEEASPMGINQKLSACTSPHLFLRLYSLSITKLTVNGCARWNLKWMWILEGYSNRMGWNGYFFLKELNRSMGNFGGWFFILSISKEKNLWPGLTVFQCFHSIIYALKFIFCIFVIVNIILTGRFVDVA